VRALLHTEFTALLARADVSQAGFARLTGVTPRQVNNWCRSRAAVPKWAAVLAGVLAEFTPEALEIMIEDADFSWCETLGVPSSSDPELARRAMTRLALAYHPDRGGTRDQMTRINAAYEKACADVEVPWS
jgi:transcriptional regulator with XRE-family HTH domain